MLIRDLLLPEYDIEMKNTRTMLERFPDHRLTYQPHVKSGTLAQLATHVATLPTFISSTIAGDSIDVASFQPPPTAGSRQELLTRFDEIAAKARQAIASADDEKFLSNWSLKNGDTVLFTMRKVDVVRRFAINHIIHHRAQLSIYYRMLDVPLPALYGPSADEQ